MSARKSSILSPRYPSARYIWNNHADVAQYEFRVRLKDDQGDWGPWSEISAPLRVLRPDEPRMNPPVLLSFDPESITVQWHPVPEAQVYSLQWRPEAAGSP